METEHGRTRVCLKPHSEAASSSAGRGRWSKRAGWGCRCRAAAGLGASGRILRAHRGAGAGVRLRRRLPSSEGLSAPMSAFPPALLCNYFSPQQKLPVCRCAATRREGTAHGSVAGLQGPVRAPCPAALPTCHHRRSPARGPRRPLSPSCPREPDQAGRGTLFQISNHFYYEL